MSHLTDGELSDYVRFVVAPDRLSQMRKHISRCAKCAEAVAFYERLQVAAFVPEVAVPAEAVARAKSIFKPVRQYERRKRAVARQIFPAPGGWAMAGVRSAMQSGMARHAVYKWVDFCIDVRAEAQPETIRMSLVGQIANETDPDGNLESVQVRLMAGRKILAKAECNRIGEFALSFAPSRQLHLEIDLPERHGLLRVPLKELNTMERTT